MGWAEVGYGVPVWLADGGSVLVPPRISKTARLALQACLQEGGLGLTKLVCGICNPRKMAGAFSCGSGPVRHIRS